MNCSRCTYRNCTDYDGVAYKSTIEAIVRVKRAHFEGSSGATASLRCNAGAAGDCSIISFGAAYNQKMLTTTELREFSHFLTTLADKLEGMGGDF